MGRRALPRVNAELELSRQLRTASELAAEVNAEQLFAVPAPLEVEVGSGKGLFLKRASQTHRERNFLGLEIGRRYAHFAAHQLALLDASNAVVVHGEAEAFFAAHLRPKQLAAVHVYFPDPWWKRRHRKRRIMNAAFIRRIEQVLAVDGRLYFWTDVEEYFRATLQLIQQTTRLQGPLAVPEAPAEHDFDYRTHFERRMRRHGDAVYRSEFQKTDASSGE